MTVRKNRKTNGVLVDKTRQTLECDDLSVHSSDPYSTLWQPHVKCPAGDHKKKKNCSANPWCLLDLVDEKKGIWKPQPACIQKLGYDPQYLRREKQGKTCKLIPSGIKNLGATCYLNVLIQMLHQNLLVRDAIFNMQLEKGNKSVTPAMKPLNSSVGASIADRVGIADNDGNSHMTMVVGALQEAFGHLGSSLKGEYDLSLFVDLLELDKSEQQDPQEFSKLFFAKLEESTLPLRDPKLPDIKQLISGKETYSTTCTACGVVSSQSNEFHEIGLNIEGHANLQLALDGYQALEMLEGENQFSCSACMKKTDATRCVKIAKTPCLLLFKLMRYYYDRKTSEKKKSQTSLEYPPELVLNGETFELVAVLYHKGNSAYGGHYVTELLEWEDREVCNWWMFDDGIVTPTLNPGASFAIKKEKGAKSSSSIKCKRGVSGHMKGTTTSSGLEEYDNIGGKKLDENDSDYEGKKPARAKKRPKKSATANPTEPARVVKKRDRKEIDVMDLSSDGGVVVINDLTQSPSKDGDVGGVVDVDTNVNTVKVEDAGVQGNESAPIAKRKRGTPSTKDTRKEAAAVTVSVESSIDEPIEEGDESVPKQSTSLPAPNLDRSKDAYLLCYIKKASKDECFRRERMAPSTAVEMAVEESSKAFLEEVKLYAQKKEHLQKQIDERKGLWTEVLRLCQKATEEKDKEGEKEEVYHLMPTAWLTQWAAGERAIVKDKKFQSSSNGKDGVTHSSSRSSSSSDVPMGSGPGNSAIDLTDICMEQDDAILEVAVDDIECVRCSDAEREIGGDNSADIRKIDDSPSENEGESDGEKEKEKEIEGEHFDDVLYCEPIEWIEPLPLDPEEIVPMSIVWDTGELEAVNCPVPLLSHNVEERDGDEKMESCDCTIEEDSVYWQTVDTIDVAADQLIETEMPAVCGLPDVRSDASLNDQEQSIVRSHQHQDDKEICSTSAVDCETTSFENGIESEHTSVVEVSNVAVAVEENVLPSDSISVDCIEEGLEEAVVDEQISTGNTSHGCSSVGEGTRDAPVLLGVPDAAVDNALLNAHVSVNVSAAGDGDGDGVSEIEYVNDITAVKDHDEVTQVTPMPTQVGRRKKIISNCGNVAPGCVPDKVLLDFVASTTVSESCEGKNDCKSTADLKSEAMKPSARTDDITEFESLPAIHSVSFSDSSEGVGHDGGDMIEFSLEPLVPVGLDICERGAEHSTLDRISAQASPHTQDNPPPINTSTIPTSDVLTDVGRGNVLGPTLFCDPITPYMLPLLCPHFAHTGVGVLPDKISSFKIIPDSAYQLIMRSLRGGLGVGTMDHSHATLHSVSHTASSSSSKELDKINDKSECCDESHPSKILLNGHSQCIHSNTIDITDATYRCVECCDSLTAAKSSIQSELIVFDNILALVDQTAYPLKDAVLVCRTWLTALRRLAETLRKRSTKKGAVVSKDGVVLDSTVNGSVVCAHGRLGLRPLARVVQVSGAAWDAIKKEFPLAVYLPVRGPNHNGHHNNNNGNNAANSTAHNGSSGGDVKVVGSVTRNSNSSSSTHPLDCCSNDETDTEPLSCEDFSNAWLCKECQNDKQEDADEFSTQKATRTHEVSCPHLYSLYSAARARNKNRVRMALKGNKRVLEDRDVDCVVDVEGMTADQTHKRYSLASLSRTGFALIDGIWLESWLDFISDPTSDKPGTIMNSALQCKHGLLLLPPKLVEISRDVLPSDLKRILGCDMFGGRGFPDMEIITMDQWIALLGIYGPRSSSTCSAVSSFLSSNTSSQTPCDLTSSFSNGEKMNTSSSDVGMHSPRDGLLHIREENNGNSKSAAVEGNHNVYNYENQGQQYHPNVNQSSDTAMIITDGDSIDALPTQIVSEIKASCKDGDIDKYADGEVGDVLQSTTELSNPFNAFLTLSDTLGSDGISGSRAGLWTWSPCLCHTCRSDIEDNTNHKHLNFTNHIFEVIVVPLVQEEISVDVDGGRGIQEVMRISDGAVVPVSISVSSLPHTVPMSGRRNPVRSRGNKKITVVLSSTDTVSLVKQKLAEKVDGNIIMGLGGHVLVYSGERLLDHSKTLRDYNVKIDEPFKLLITNSELCLDVFYSEGRSGRENGFRKNAFLRGSSSAEQTTVSFVPDEEQEEKIRKVVDFTAQEAKVAKETLMKCDWDVDDAVEVLLSSA